MRRRRIRDGELEVAVNPETLDIIIQTTSLVIDGVKVEGVYSFQRITENAIPYIALTVNGGKMTKAAEWFTFTTTKKYFWKEGEATPGSEDDIFEVVSGEYFLTLKDNGLGMLELENPLLVKYGCGERSLLPVSVTVSVDLAAGATMVDFGDGQCDTARTQQ